jgi:hypothetical protein
VADVALVGAAEVGDEVVVNTLAADLAPGSGGFDVVHVNLTRGLEAAGVDGAHVMKLEGSSLQHAVLPVDREGPAVPLGRPLGVVSLHAEMPPLAWALQRARPGARLGYVQTAGGALPGGHSRAVRELRERRLLAGFITAGPAYGGECEALTTAGAIDHGLTELRWDAAVCGPGPGVPGSGSAVGDGGMAALDSAHAALALGCPVVVCGVSHRTRTVLELVLAPVTVAVPEGRGEDVPRGRRHEVLERAADLDGYRAARLPALTLDEDPLLFAAALVAGEALAAKIPSA